VEQLTNVYDNLLASNTVEQVQNCLNQLSNYTKQKIDADTWVKNGRKLRKKIIQHMLETARDESEGAGLFAGIKQYVQLRFPALEELANQLLQHSFYIGTLKIIVEDLFATSSEEEARTCLMYWCWKHGPSVEIKADLLDNDLVMKNFYKEPWYPQVSEFQGLARGMAKGIEHVVQDSYPDLTDLVHQKMLLPYTLEQIQKIQKEIFAAVGRVATRDYLNSLQ
jgi:hypothetical protein